MRYTLCALLAFSTLLAGCSMPAADGDPAGVGTVTPVPVTDAGSVDRVVTTRSAESVTGLEEGPFADLLDDHEAAVSNASYAYRIERTSRGDLFANRTIRGYRGGTEGVYLHEHLSPRGRELAWSNGSASVTEVGEASGTTYEIRGADRIESFDSVAYLRQTLAFARPTTTVENDTHYEIDATFVSRDGRSVFGPAMRTENASLSVTVTKDGVIEAYRFEARGHYRKGERIHVVERFTLDRSADTLPRPEWVEAALSNGS